MTSAPIIALAGALWLGAAPEKVPYYFDRPLTERDLDKLTLRELDLVRNTIYARQGHTFRKKWLRDYFTAQPWYHPKSGKDETKPSALDLKNAAFVAEFASQQIDKEELVNMWISLRNKRSPTPEDQIELQLVARALGGPKGVKEAVMVTPLDDPSQLEELIDSAVLNDYSRRDLRLLRNTIYARRGRPFKSPLLRKYFERMDWYRADPAYTDARLTKMDKRNIKLIQEAEVTAGGPMTDAEMGDAVLSQA